MSTASQIAVLLRPFLERHPEFVLVGRRVIRRPVGHVMRGFFIDRTSSKGAVQPFLATWTMYCPPPQYLSLELRHLQRGAGHLDDPGIQDVLLTEMEAAVETDILPAMELGQLLGYLQNTSPLLKTPSIVMAVIFAALGRFSDAERCLQDAFAALDKTITWQDWFLTAHFREGSRAWHREKSTLEWLLARKAGLQEFEAVLTLGDRAALAALLHVWEAKAYSVEKLDQLYQPSPFPFEASAGG